tara:strand:- start:272 stop:553 length:282 start_codon:yes stop_codon:yes gene_type:complete
MEKFLKIPISTGGHQLLSLKDILTITSASSASTDVTIAYINGTIAVITSAAQSDYNQRDMIVTSVIAALDSSYLYVTYEPVLPEVVSLITITP